MDWCRGYGFIVQHVLDVFENRIREQFCAALVAYESGHVLKNVHVLFEACVVGDGLLSGGVTAHRAWSGVVVVCSHRCVLASLSCAVIIPDIFIFPMPSNNGDALPLLVVAN